MLATLVLALLAVLALVVPLARRALREEFWVVLYWPKQACFILEQRGPQQYAVISPIRLPWSLARYLGYLVLRWLQGVRFGVLARWAGRRTSPLGLKA